MTIATFWIIAFSKIFHDGIVNVNILKYIAKKFPFELKRKKAYNLCILGILHINDFMRVRLLNDFLRDSFSTSLNDSLA